MKQEKYIYFDVQHAIEVHDWIIDTSGGRPGIIDPGLIESTLEHIQNDLYYSSFESKLAHLVFSINKNHAFNDGNKRSSIALGGYFLEINGYEYCVQYFIQEMENIAVWIAENKINKELTEEIVTSLIIEDDLPEALKFKIAKAVST